MSATTDRFRSRPLLLLLLVLGLLLGSAAAVDAKPGNGQGQGQGQGAGQTQKTDAEDQAPAKGKAAPQDRRGDTSGPEPATEPSTGTETTDEGRSASSKSGPSKSDPSNDGPSSGQGGGPEKCVSYYFEYVDGHVDRATELCIRGFDVPGHGDVVLHVSCSDTFPYRESAGGHVSDGASQLAGHVIAHERWWIQRENGTYCGFPGAGSTPDPDPVCTLTVEVREDSRTGALVPGGTGSVTTTAGTTSRSLAGSTDWGTVPCGDVSATLTSPPDGYRTLDGSDATTITDGRGTLILTVEELAGDPPCQGPLTIEVRHADTDALVTVAGGVARIDGASRTLDADGRTAGGTFDCGTEVDGTLTTPPAGYVTVDGSDETTVLRSGGTLVFTVRQATTGTPTCTGPLEIRVVDTDGALVQVGGAVATIAGSVTELDDDGRTAGGSYVCDTVVRGTLDTPPTGFRTVDGRDRTTVTEDGGTLEFVVARDLDVGGVVDEDCLGRVLVRVVTTEGTLIDGATVRVDGADLAVTDGIEPIDDVACGPVGGVLIEAPAGHEPVGPESATVTVRDDDTAELEFVVTPVEVRGIVVDREPPAAPDAGEPAAATEPGDGAGDGPAAAPADRSGLARTGIGADGMLTLAAALLLLGLVALGVVRPERFRRIGPPGR